MSDPIQTHEAGLEAVRHDFPILQRRVGGKPLVYLDNAATAQKPRAVIECLDHYYREENANIHRGVHLLSQEATSAYEDARARIARFIGAGEARSCIFTRGATEAINLVASSWGASNLREGDEIILTTMEHHANIVPWQILAPQLGFTLKFITLNPDGTLDMDAFKRLLHDNPVKLVAVTHVSNVLGIVNPIQEITRLAHEHGAIVLVDGAQSVPHMPVDVTALDCDFFAFSAHKMAGPTGIGILYGKRALLDAMPPFFGGGDMISRVTLEGSTWNDLPYKFEAGTPSIAEGIGLGATIDYLSDIGMDKIHEYEQIMTHYLLDRLSEVNGVTVFGTDPTRKGAVASFTVAGMHAHDVAQLLDSHGVAVRAGHHCAMPLHDYLGVSATSRASLYFYNTPREVDAFIVALEKAKTTFAI